MDKELKLSNSYLEESVDTGFSSVRNEENPIGNFICDLMKKELSTDCAIINSGNIRADKVYDAGFMTIGDWNDLIPFEVPVLKIQCTGLMLKNACENAVSKWPALEGRFIQTSSLHFKFDPSKEPGNRVKIEDVTVGDIPVQEEELYTVATSNYIAKGKDGFDCLVGCGILIDAENAP